MFPDRECRDINERMDDSIEQRYIVKFYVALKKSKVETITLLKEAFQNETLHDSAIHRWHRAFTDGRKSVEIEHVGGRSRTVVTDANINIVPAVIEEDSHSSI